MKTNYFIHATVVLSIVLVSLLVVLSTPPVNAEKTMSLNGIEISEEDMVSYIDTFGSNPIRLQELDSGRCIDMQFNGTSLNYQECS